MDLPTHKEFLGRLESPRLTTARFPFHRGRRVRGSTYSSPFCTQRGSKAPAPETREALCLCFFHKQRIVKKVNLHSPALMSGTILWSYTVTSDCHIRMGSELTVHFPPHTPSRAPGRCELKYIRLPRELTDRAAAAGTTLVQCLISDELCA